MPGQRVNGRLCTECGNPLPAGSSKRRKTCGDNCRSKRSRRLRGAKVTSEALPPHQAQLANAVDTEVPDIAHQVIQEEMRPVVREAITEDVLRGVKQLVALTPAAVEQLRADLESGVPAVQRKAAELVMRYTIGHQALVTKDETSADRQLVVQFNLPRPDGEAPQPEVQADAEEIRTCDTCGSDKPVAQFVDNSTRCIECHEQIRQQALARLMKGDGES